MQLRFPQVTTPIVAAHGTPLLSRIPRLDGWRGVAILLVLLCHFGIEYPTPTEVDSIVWGVLHIGWSGVDLFFVLSGFLITGILIETREATNYFHSFWTRRILRIVPAYYSFLAIWFLVLPHLAQVLGLHAHFGQEHQLVYWTWTANLFMPVYQLTPLWSLSVEEQFYLFWPVVVVSLSNRRLACLCFALVVGCPIIRALLFSFPWVRYDGLALGALVAVLVRNDTWLAFARRRWKLALAGSAGSAALVFAAIGSVDLAPDDPVVSILISFIDIAFAALLVGTLVGDHTSAGFRWLDQRWLQTWGKYSYGVYLFHFPIAAISLNALRDTKWWPWLQVRSIYIVFMAFGIALSFMIAYVSWHVLERRFLSLKGRFVARIPQWDEALGDAPNLTANASRNAAALRRN